MAQWKADTQTFDQLISRRYEVMMLANNANGDIVSITNPLPVTLGSENITITGNVNFVDTVNVASTPENPVHTHITEVGNGGLLTVPYLPIGGNVNVTNVVTVTGNVNANVTFPTSYEISNDVGNPIPISKNGIPNSAANPINVNLIGSGEASGISSSIDSKGRLKVQTQETIFFNTFQYGKESDVWDESTANGANAIFDSSVSGIRMSVTNQVGSKVIRQTRNVQRYTPGRCQSIAFAVRLENPVAGVRRRFGMFDGNDGFFFEDCGTIDATTGLPQYACVVINSDGITPTVERVYRDDWNGDKLNGAGPSGITAVSAAQQLVMIDYEWYGAGQITFSFVINGLPRVIHTFNNGNRLLSPWCRTPFLPIRVELENFGGAAGTHYMWQGSNSLLTEGSVEKLGIGESIMTPLTGVNLQLARTFYPVISIRMKSNNLTGIILPAFFQAGTIDNTDIYYQLIRNPTVNGTWVDHPDPNAFTQYNYSSTGAITNGIVLLSGLINAGSGSAQIKVDESTVYQLGRGSMGTVSDIITLAIASKNANKDAVAAMTWIEQR